MKTGKLIISLDFELHWGAVERWDLQKKKTYFDTTRIGIPKTLALFKKFDIAATWATVGFLFAKDRAQLNAFVPEAKPSYDKKEFDYYRIHDTLLLGNSELDDPYHYGSSLIEQIIETPKQELASHTFSHYYCNEPGQSIKEFKADLNAAQALAKENYGITLTSLVFPRNQFNKQYLEVIKATGFSIARANPNVWFWKINHVFVRLIRAIDTLASVSSRTSYTMSKSNKSDEVLLLPASRFLRPFSLKEKRIQGLKRKRVLKEMTTAAKRGEVYHLWWHPHNFGDHLEENLDYLTEILTHYKHLNATYGFESHSMNSAYS